MSFLNRIIVEGNIGKDFDLKETRSGTPWVCFPIAVNEEWFDSSGEQQQKTNWFMVKVYGNNAVNAHKYLCSGCKIIVEGKLAVEDWRSKDGGEWEQILIVGTNLRYMDSKNTLKRKRVKNKVMNKLEEGDERFFEKHLHGDTDDYNLDL